MPVVSSYFLISSLSLIGFPFLSGFYSKDSVIELFETSGVGVLAFLILLVCVLRTVVYRIRLIIRLYGTEINSKLLVLGLREPLLSIKSILILYISSIVGGSLFINSVVPMFLIRFSLILKLTVLVSII